MSGFIRTRYCGSIKAHLEKAGKRTAFKRQIEFARITALRQYKGAFRKSREAIRQLKDRLNLQELLYCR
ncbi:MAG: hypothetical protein LBP62_01255 [Clostridiales bacterium]|nr:hypothetical protein [Clostridiales bacterium]